MTIGVCVAARCAPPVAAASGTNLARAAGAGCPAPSDHGCSELATLNPSLGVVVSVIYLAGHVHTVVLRNSPHRLAWGRCEGSSVPARTLISHTGFLNRCARLRFVHTPRTPAR